MKSKSLQQFSEIFSEFCKARQWHHNNPNQLITAMLIELGELSEHYQWQDKFPQWEETEKTEVGYEFVDVFLYFIRLAELSNIDIEKYFDEKIPKLDKKFPLPEKHKILSWEEKIIENKKQRAAYRKNGKNKLY